VKVKGKKKCSAKDPVSSHLPYFFHPSWRHISSN
jgi:hypothetical protein